MKRLFLCFSLILCLYSIDNLVSQNKTQKNLLFIITDQQRYDALTIAGNFIIKTPNLDRLAKSGAYFKNAYTPVAVCGPARACILTGTTINTNGVTTNDKTYYYNTEPVMTMKTFDEILSEKGYHTLYFGKWHVLTNHAKVYKNNKKFAKNGKYIFDHGGQNYLYQDYLDSVFPKRNLERGELLDYFSNRPYVPDPIDVNFGLTYKDLKNKKPESQPNYHGKSSIPAEHTITAFYAKKTIAAIERLKDKPFSITTSFHFPHAPMIPSEPYHSMYDPNKMIVPESINDQMENSPYKNANNREKLPQFADKEKIKYMIANYYGLISEIDFWVGKILDKLEETNLTENTLIIFTSDHGEMLGAHGMREKNVFYEESSHVPLFISMPSEIPKNTKVDGYVSNVDLFATIIDYLKAGDYKSDGQSLRDLIENKETNHGKYVVTEWDYRGPTAPNYMIVKGGWKMMIPYTEDSKVLDALYNLKDDPLEMNNLLGKNPNKKRYADIVTDLKNDLLLWLQKNNSKHYQGVLKRKLI